MPKNRPETPNRPIRLLVTAGPTHEPIDAVRFIGNRSSGRMGLALVQSGLARGWDTTLLLGPTALPVHTTNIQLRRFRTAVDLGRLLDEHVAQCDVLIMAAAVADYRPVEEPAGTKLRRGKKPMELRLEPVSDLLAGLGNTKRVDQYFVGFALEPGEELAARARVKLTEKRLDAIVGNPLETMDAPDAEGVVLMRDGKSIVEVVISRCSKEDFAARIVDVVAGQVVDLLSNV